jgi:NAD(P)-dependent dehydrogenase (short-subunit alcohol dehydrogenase family)
MNTQSPLPQEPRFANGVAFVVGGSGAIGRAICIALAKRGSDVVLTYRNNCAAAEEVANEIRTLGRKADISPLALENPEAVKALVDGVAEKAGVIHSVVYAAGPNLPIKFINSLTPEEWKGVFDADVNGCFNLVWATLPHLKKQGAGAYVAVITAAVDRAPPRDILSAAPKAAVQMLIRGVALEEGRFGIRANCVGPGLIDGGLGQKLLHEGHNTDYADRMRKAVPLKRAGLPEDLGEAAAFLLSSAAGYITGQSIHVDGGLQL